MKNNVIKFTLLLSFSNCATDQAAKVRSDRPFTLGYLGAAVRQTQNLGISVHGTTGPASGFFSGDDRSISLKGRNINLRTEFFIWDSSAFYVGIGYSRSWGKMTFDANQIGSTTNKTSVTYSQTIDRTIIPVGWFWIWNNGITFQLDFGPSFVSKTVSGYSDDGGTNVDTTDRNNFIADYEGKNGAHFMLLPNFLLGYSF